MYDIVLSLRQESIYLKILVPYNNLVNVKPFFSNEYERACCVAIARTYKTRRASSSTYPWLHLDTVLHPFLQQPCLTTARHPPAPLDTLVPLENVNNDMVSREILQVNMNT